MRLWALMLMAALTGSHCTTPKKPGDPAAFNFTALPASQTGLHFQNSVLPNAINNMFNYMYFYNGGGVAAADFNKDGLTDLFFTANQLPNKLFLNLGALQFQDITEKTHIDNHKSWSTGVSVTDINQDGLIDIYICKASYIGLEKAPNQLWVCKGIEQGIPIYEEKAAHYGLDFSGLSTQAAFFDFDGDDDLDMFLLNHAASHVGRFADRNKYLGTYDSITGDRLFRCDGDRFTDITQQTGMHSSAIGYGLGLAVQDINMDGWPDVYVANDFEENDYLYINNGAGKLIDESPIRLAHTSQYSMGVDIADINNDGHPEIMTLDMLPELHYMQKRSLSEDSYDLYQLKLRMGYHPYATRNNLQLNLRNNRFCEVGCYAGLAATDWSWSCLFEDFDLDGNKDVFITNGIPKRLNDIDWVNFISQDWLQSQLASSQVSDSLFKLVNAFPEIRVPNKFFKNNGHTRFVDVTEQIKNNQPGFSNGAAYADFDNDGDLDLVTNNLNDPATLYENQANPSSKNRPKSIFLKGSPNNQWAVGARLFAFSGASIQAFHHHPVHGYLSSMQVPLYLSTGSNKIDSAWLVWPDRTAEKLNLETLHATDTIQWKPGLPNFDFQSLSSSTNKQAMSLVDITEESGLLQPHQENFFNEFNREQLMPQLVGTEGPALAVGDVNNDGLDDVFLGGSMGYSGNLFIQTSQGKFYKTQQPALMADAAFEDVDAGMADINGDGRLDLIVASGGNQWPEGDDRLKPRLYLNLGLGKLIRQEHAFPIGINAGALAIADVNADQLPDLFIGSRTQSGQFGKTAPSYLLINNGQGQFKDATNELAPSLSTLGQVKNARWINPQNLPLPQLLVARHWEPVLLFSFKGKKMEPISLGSEKGWWNQAIALPTGSQSQPAIAVGNAGLNLRLNPSAAYPIKLYLNDFDANGSPETILTWHLNGREEIFATRDELQKQIPGIKKKFLYAADFGKASLSDIFPNETWQTSKIISANEFSSGIYWPKPSGYQFIPFPWQAQLSSIEDMVVLNANGDHLPDLFCVGNFFGYTQQIGRTDGNYGWLLINKGAGNFEMGETKGTWLEGECRRIKPVTIAGKPALVVGVNNGYARIIRLTN